MNVWVPSFNGLVGLKSCQVGDTWITVVHIDTMKPKPEMPGSFVLDSETWIQKAMPDVLYNRISKNFF